MMNIDKLKYKLLTFLVKTPYSPLCQVKKIKDQLGECLKLYSSVDNCPWAHPFLNHENIARFRSYSEEIWKFAADYRKKNSIPCDCAFSVNIAQNMYKWSSLAQKYGWKSSLYLNPMDNSALSFPQWEEFDGEQENILDRETFEKNNPDIPVAVPLHSVSMDGSELIGAFQEFHKGRRTRLLKILHENPSLKYEPFLCNSGIYPYFSWAKQLAQHDVIYTASNPVAAYLSGRPYCLFAIGGDTQFDCGRGDDYGQVMNLAFASARFLLISNPHQLGHSRRLGLLNGVYLPYPMDSAERYCPGEGIARKKWEADFGPGAYALITSRLDKDVKGFGDAFFNALKNAAVKCKDLKYIFLSWGSHAEEFKNKIQSMGLGKQFIILKPVGKKRLIDYYRSCDFVIDQFVYGYYGATALEAASIGKPVIMKIREEHYSPLYKGDIAPVLNCDKPDSVEAAILSLAENTDLRSKKGTAMREWLVRTHGEEKTVPIMLDILKITADRVKLPQEIIDMNPLTGPLTDEERNYHDSCIVKKE